MVSLMGSLVEGKKSDVAINLFSSNLTQLERS